MTWQVLDSEQRLGNEAADDVRLLTCVSVVLLVAVVVVVLVTFDSLFVKMTSLV